MNITDLNDDNDDGNHFKGIIVAKRQFGLAIGSQSIIHWDPCSLSGQFVVCLCTHSLRNRVSQGSLGDNLIKFKSWYKTVAMVVDNNNNINDDDIIILVTLSHVLGNHQDDSMLRQANVKQPKETEIQIELNAIF